MEGGHGVAIGLAIDDSEEVDHQNGVQDLLCPSTTYCNRNFLFSSSKSQTDWLTLSLYSLGLSILHARHVFDKMRMC